MATNNPVVKSTDHRPREHSTVRLAQEADNPQICSILSETAMAGSISVSFRRNPDYFESAKVFGPFRETCVAMTDNTNHITALGARAARPRYVNGVPTEIGYMYDLRIAKKYRKSGMIGQLLKFLLETQAARPVKSYLIAITEENIPALKLLKTKLKNAPSFKDFGTYHTASISLRKKRKKPQPEKHGLTIRQGTFGDLRMIVKFLNDNGRGKQFFPVYDENDFFNADGTMVDLNPKDIMLAFRGDHLVGVLGGWDQHRYRQTVLNRYSKLYKRTRPLYNLIAPLIGMPKLPAVGQELQYLNGAIPVVKDDDPDVFRSLVDTILYNSQGRQWDFLVIGLHATHPLKKTLDEYKAIRYRSKIFMVYWGDQQKFVDSIKEESLYLELGCL